MSYTPPTGSAIGATWQFAGAYTPPVGTAISAGWFSGATGFSSTAFGTPTVIAGEEQVGVASSLAPGVFGEPSGIQSYTAGTVPASFFGSPSLSFTPVSIQASQFGTPSGQSLLRSRSLLATSRFGTPLALFVDRTCEAQGFASNIGKPYGGLFTTPTYNTVTKARYVVRATFGAPSSPVQQACVASSVSASRFGAPVKGAAPLTAFGVHTSFFVYPAAGFVSSAFGAHNAASGHVVSGFAQSAFGSPSVGREQTAAATNRTRFGTPLSDMRGVHKTYGFRRSWFGNHISLRDISAVSGWQASGFGESTSYEVHRALHIPPEHKFGAPLMKRIV